MDPTLPCIEGPIRRRSHDLSYNYLERFDVLQEAEKGIPMSQFYPYMTVRDLVLEFRLIKKITETREHAERLMEASPETLSENRYPDILPFRDTLVRLNNGYINANLVDGPFEETEELFVVTQGPLPGTRVKFWDMVFQCNVALIVMGCHMMEGGIEKCDQYFPADASAGVMKVGPYTIKLVKFKVARPGAIHRRFTAQHEDSDTVLTIDHIHMLNWPDRGFPVLTTEADALDYMLDYMEKRSVPGQKILVHCSAGCGRSGMIVGLYCLVTSLKSLIQQNSTPRVSVFGTVRRLREQRWGLVQTKEQYIFLYHYMEYWISKHLAEGSVVVDDPMDGSVDS